MPRRPFAFLLPLLLGSTALHAQTFDVPSFRTPFVENGVGVYAFSPQADEYGGLLTWRQAGERTDVGLRGGYLNVADQAAYTLGVEVARTTAPREGSRGAAALVTGFEVGWAPDEDRARARLPLGIVWGHRREAAGLAYIPYLHPRVLLDVDFEDAGGGWDEDLDLGFAVDLGFDAEIQRSMLLRFAATLGHEAAIGAGVAFAF